jgi:hypothetical protein
VALLFLPQKVSFDIVEGRHEVGVEPAVVFANRRPPLRERATGFLEQLEKSLARLGHCRLA